MKSWKTSYSICVNHQHKKTSEICILLQDRSKLNIRLLEDFFKTTLIVALHKDGISISMNLQDSSAFVLVALLPLKPY